jgi:hypothetical protein
LTVKHRIPAGILEIQDLHSHYHLQTFSVDWAQDAARAVLHVSGFDSFDALPPHDHFSARSSCFSRHELRQSKHK